MVPNVELPPATPFTLQVALELKLPVPVTPLVKVCVAPSSTLAEGGVAVTAKSLRTVTCAVAVLAGSAWLVAVTLTVAGEGRICGAV